MLKNRKSIARNLFWTLAMQTFPVNLISGIIFLAGNFVIKEYSSSEPPVRFQSSQTCEKLNSQVKQSSDGAILRNVRSTGCTDTSQNKRHFDIKSNGVIQKDNTINPRIQTTYQRHFNNTADSRLGYCNNTSIAERHRYFKSCQSLQDHSLQITKLRNVASAGKYKSDKKRRISEYMAETSHIGGAIMKSGIHNHLKCRNRNCTHFITFR